MSKSGYDQYVTVFSNEGRLYQIEYAFKSVKLGGLLALALRGKDCVVGVSQKKVNDTLIDASFVTNIYPIGDHIACITVGLPADGRTVATRARQKAGDFMDTNGFPIPVHVLSEELADMAQLYTQHAYMRPYGVATMLLSVDDEAGPQLYRCDPSGYFASFKAVANGVKDEEAMNVLERLYRKSEASEANSARAVENALLAMQTTLGADISPERVEVVVCEAGKVRVLSNDEVDERLNALQDHE